MRGLFTLRCVVRGCTVLVYVISHTGLVWQVHQWYEYRLRGSVLWPVTFTVIYDRVTPV